ncbi:MAG: AAA family ATPase [Iodobacter sp.]
MLLFIQINKYKPDVASGKRNIIYLSTDNWDDFSYKTQFYLHVEDEHGVLHDIGEVKIGYVSQPESSTTQHKLIGQINGLSNGFFSLGQDVSYYSNINKLLSTSFSNDLCIALHDVVHNSVLLKEIENEGVFKTSLLRSVSYSSIHGQFKRVLNGGALLSKYDFSYRREMTDKNSAVDLAFRVVPESMPSTNIHVLIGRNGVGKTSILNGMVNAITGNKNNTENFYMRNTEEYSFLNEQLMSDGYFSALISVTFSAFDPFIHPKEKKDVLDGTGYYYVGLKNESSDSSSYSLRTMHDLAGEFSKSLSVCLSDTKKKHRWEESISTLAFDSNFSEMELHTLLHEEKRFVVAKAESLFKRMSSGHAIVLLSITRIVERLEEKTLVLIDEPESHLHPPLLSAFIRALSNLLINRNAVAIIATHSPVILQEVPKSCVWKLWRSRLEFCSERPTLETFGENVGVLTHEVFNLDYSKSGFHQILKEAVLEENSTYDSILSTYDMQLGFEARSILRALIYERDNGMGEKS